MMNMKVSEKVLRRKKPFEHYSRAALKELSRSCQLGFYQPGEMIFNQGDQDQKSAFILSGKIHLIARDRDELLVITPFQDKSRLPLSCIKPRIYTAVAASYETCVLWVHDLIRKHVEHKHHINSPVEAGIYSEIINLQAYR